jgi:uncharacterized membrane protein YidH (DUF202 family)
MANERTALDWVRTGLALIAGGIALTSVSAVRRHGAGQASAGMTSRSKSSRPEVS